MDDSELDERLRTAETGVLSLARDGEAYGIPLAHYYDGEHLYFRLGDAGDTKKRQFIESTTTACYVVYEAKPTEAARGLDSWSILITGTLRDLSEEERATFDTVEINRDFSPIRVFDEDVADIDVEIVALEIETMTGRITSE